MSPEEVCDPLVGDDGVAACATGTVREKTVGVGENPSEDALLVRIAATFWAGVMDGCVRWGAVGVTALIVTAPIVPGRTNTGDCGLEAPSAGDRICARAVTAALSIVTAESASIVGGPAVRSVSGRADVGTTIT